MSNLPIGLFDSGLGGTSIWKEIHALLPGENTIYLADSRNAPYGVRPKADIIRLSTKNTELLLEKGCKLIVVACNTATTNAIQVLRDTYNIPFIGIEPAIKPASLQTKTGAIGILATKGTLSSALFHHTSNLFANGHHVVEQEGDGIVELIEQGRIDTDDMRALLSRYLKPMLEAKIDHLVLGCTHYPYLIPLLKEMLPEDVTIIDSGKAVARQTKAILEQHGLLNSPKGPSAHRFYTNTDTQVMESLIGKSHTIAYLDF